MEFSVVIVDRADRSRSRIPASDLRRIMAAIETMRADPFSGDVVKLKDTDAYRRRVGSYRIIFSVDFASLTVRILDVLRRTTTTHG
jgi:mRNA-degrading endonuclease RelE of RelBE toxin-antitoxin system